MTYCIAIETAEGTKPYGYHFGTCLITAERLVHEKLRQPGVKSIALYQGSALPGFGGKLVRIYDWRDLPEYEGDDE